ncbi:MAG: hypothetical protein LC753_19505 [Acidobacteria bacterium]|nr:hypothetical protein [Acidobacteriota bacterium]
MLASLVFDSALLGSMLEAVERRGKAIRYHGTLDCEREIDRGVERLTVSITSLHSLRLRLHLSADGSFWLGVNNPRPKRQGGWEINRQLTGVIGTWTPSEVAARLVEPESRAVWVTERTSVIRQLIKVVEEIDVDSALK